MKERTAKSYIKFMRDKEIILKDPSNQSYYIIGNLKQYYKEKDLHEFIRRYFDGKNVGKCKRNVMKVSVQRMVCYLVMRTKQWILANNLTLYVSFVLS